jgi:3-methyladenine DNA glycosylase AlkC
MTEDQGLKGLYGGDAARRLGEHIVVVYPQFEVDGYAAAVEKGVQGLELKARLKVLMEELRVRLPSTYAKALGILVASLGAELNVNEGIFKQGWFWSPALLFVQTYGLEEPELSLSALNAMTRRNTAEEAIRPFIVRHYELTMRHLWEWVTDESFHVRRLVSEGTRPRLPWAMRLDRFVAEPRPALALLESLRDDDAVYVQKSVANHLNDVAKDHPALVLDIAERWMQEDPTPARTWIVRHGLRTLIKAGEPRALAVLGAEPLEGIRVEWFEATPASIHLGDHVRMRVVVVNESDIAQTLVVDYAIHFVIAKGTQSKKVFKWATFLLAPGERKVLEKSHSFRPITTRRYYAGAHRFEVQVNGEVLAGAEVELR